LSLINEKTLLRIDETKTISNNASILNESELKRSFQSGALTQREKRKSLDL